MTEGLPSRRLGVVAQAAATTRRDDKDPYVADKPERRLVPVAFPAQIPLEGGCDCNTPRPLLVSLLRRIGW